ncbi:Nucleobase-ascorbate transporter 12 [Dendrobium catenatum]|uniref:Nucleobase-ascorbate transporter 12 n=1 Tax=Dendrobium catenatum TaxID=906689 RepID=A0A2I0W2C2_9ASPA|nr:Nucleobase-ascorbate transporter 12 [Dendrobium catenatum]
MATRDRPPRRARPGPWPPAGGAAAGPTEGVPPPLSWAKRTGFKGRVSGESNASSSGQIALPKPKEAESNVDLESGKSHVLPTPPVLPSLPVGAPAVTNGQQVPVPVDPMARKRRDSDGGGAGQGQKVVGAGQNGQHRSEPPVLPKQRREEEANALPPVREDDNGVASRQSHIKYELRETPGLVPIVLYGIQHYLSILGSLVLIPLVIVPAMGGTSEDTAAVVSTVLFISGVTTLLHTFFGTRLPLIQGPSFVYLAPALAIINSPEFQGLNGNWEH